MKHKTRKQKQAYDSWLREANRLIKEEKQFRAKKEKARTI